MSAKRTFFGILCVLGMATFFFPAHVDAMEGDYVKLLQALESDNLEEFSRLLENGADPNDSVESLYRTRWVICLAAQKESDAWLRAIKAHGGDIHQTRHELLTNIKDARYANALLCSVLNFPVEPFAYLLENGAEYDQTYCPLCKHAYHQRTFLEHVTRFAQYNKSAWLLEKYPESKRQINDMVIWNLETQPAGLRDDRREGFWKTVDIIREAGYDVNPKPKR